MIADIKLYPVMKDSGVTWLGEVPEHWEGLRLKSVMHNVIEQSIKRESTDRYIALEHVESWTGRTKEAPSDMAADSQVKRFQADDVLFGKLRPYLAKVTRPKNGGVCVGEFLVLRPSVCSVTTAYMEKLLRSGPIIDAVSSSTFGAKMPRADWQFVGGMLIPLPPLSEQAAIVRYLDYVDRRIRKYIRAKKKLIKLLEEQKQAIIHHAVTRGLNPNVRLKPSGVEWLGDVTEHWKVRRIRNVAEMLVSNVDKHTKEGEKPVRLCNYVDVYKNDRITEQMTFMVATALPNEIKRFRLERGDVIITKDSEMWNDIGVPALVQYDAPDLVCGYHLAILRAHTHVMKGAYLFRILQSPAITNQFRVAAHGVTRYGLSHAAIKSVILPLPPIVEQNTIVSFLDEATEKIITVINRAHGEIALLREYRTRLIADVVTGKLDVREVAAQLPDEADEPEPIDDAEELTNNGPDDPVEELADAE